MIMVWGREGGGSGRGKLGLDGNVREREGILVLTL